MEKVKWKRSKPFTFHFLHFTEFKKMIDKSQQTDKMDLLPFFGTDYAIYRVT